MLELAEFTVLPLSLIVLPLHEVAMKVFLSQFRKTPKRSSIPIPDRFVCLDPTRFLQLTYPRLHFLCQLIRQQHSFTRFTVKMHL